MELKTLNEVLPVSVFAVIQAVENRKCATTMPPMVSRFSLKQGRILRGLQQRAALKKFVKCVTVSSSSWTKNQTNRKVKALPL